MQIGNNELLAMLEKYRAFELDNAKRCREKEEKLKNVGAKLVLAQIRMDSEKYAYVYQTLIGMIEEGVPSYLLDYKCDRFIGLKVVTPLLRDYLELEKNMVDDCSDILQRSNDPGIQMILQYLMADKKIHEKLLNDVVTHLYKLGPIAIQDGEESQVEKKPSILPLHLLLERLTNHLRQ